MSNFAEILSKKDLARDDLVRILSAVDPRDIDTVQKAADSVRERYVGNKVYYRGLIEFSNVCVNDCDYCGIRKSNTSIDRYTLTQQEIVDAALWCAAQGYGSVVLQSGERTDEKFIGFVEEVVREIKSQSISSTLPQGLGVTLCVGEQSESTYTRLIRAGAHRYLLRVETTNPRLFSQIHPQSQRLENRIDCLRTLKRIGYQVGTGVMIGLPGQTVEDLADDILFFRELDVDMIGMGPYIVHHQTPMAIHAGEVEERHEQILRWSLLMIGAVRILLKNVNIAATTALQAADPLGREKGLSFGANIIMPQVTPVRVRTSYLLYDGKPCLDESAEQCRGCLERRIRSVGREVGYGEWGDSAHAVRDR